MNETCDRPGASSPLLSRRGVLAGMLAMVATPAMAGRARPSRRDPPIAGNARSPRPFRYLARERHTITDTNAGRVIAGGYYNGALTSVQIYDGQNWREGPPMLTARFQHAAAPFGDGLIVTGGVSAAGDRLSDAEFFDGRQWQRLPPMRIPRSQAAAVPWNGGILVAGGLRDAPLTSVEVFDGAVWQPAASLTIPRYGHTAGIVRGLARVEGGFHLDRLTVAEAFDGVRWSLESTSPVPGEL
jgi:hypothetical protein